MSDEGTVRLTDEVRSGSAELEQIAGVQRKECRRIRDEWSAAALPPLSNAPEARSARVQSGGRAAALQMRTSTSGCFHSAEAGKSCVTSPLCSRLMASSFPLPAASST